MVHMYLLSRSRTYLEIVRLFGSNVSLWCKVHNYMINHVFITFSHLIHNNLEYFHTKFPSYNQKIREFIVSEVMQYRFETSTALDSFMEKRLVIFYCQINNCNTVIGLYVRICKPGVVNINQLSMYNGHDTINQ